MSLLSLAERAVQHSATCVSREVKLLSGVLLIIAFLSGEVGCFALQPFGAGGASRSFKHKHRRPQSNSQPPSRCCLVAYSAAPSSVGIAAHHRTDYLESLTVKELRQMVKETTDERGLVSRLKRKQDLVEYLATAASSAAYNSQSMGDEAPQPQQPPMPEAADQPRAQEAGRGSVKTGRGSPPSSSPLTPQPSVTLPRMPPLINRNGIVQQQLPQSPLSPKDLILEQVYERYPTLHRLPEGTSSDDGNCTADVDVRQRYHPVLTNNRSSCDMDLVFVGTASCTPGTTRGVSCTALRLNWKRRAASWFGLGSKEGNPSNRPGGATQAKTPSATAVTGSSFQGGTWLFDVGECTQLQVQRTSSVRPSKIAKIFLTHAHGDHSFGLPGLLCLMGQDRERSSASYVDAASSSAGLPSSSGGPPQPVDIYGPEGLRMWLRVAIRYSVSRIVPPYRVHELKQVPMAPEWDFNSRTRRYYYRGLSSSHSPQHRRKSWGDQGLAGEDPTNWISQASRMPLQPSSLYGEVDGGRDIYPVYDHPLSSDGAPVWEVEDEEDVKVYAAPMSHGIPCVGYVVEELPTPGRLRNEVVLPVVQRNIPALKQAGFAVPMKAMAVIKNLAPGSSFTFPDGTVVTQEEAVEPPRPGRKVVICGDTADSRALRNLAQNADVVVHEATNTYLAGVDKDTDLRATTRDAIVHGHSTPYMAGEFARSVNAKRLILNHFSARYKGDVSPDSLSIMMRIERQAMKASGLSEMQVAAAWDLMVLPVPKEGSAASKSM